MTSGSPWRRRLAGSSERPSAEPSSLTETRGISSSRATGYDTSVARCHSHTMLSPATAFQARKNASTIQPG